MNQKKIFMGIVGLAAAFLISALAANHDAPELFPQSAEDLYQAALLKKEAEGDLSGAVKLFQSMIVKFPDKRDIAAKAQLQIGLCYEKLGTKEAEKAFQKVIDNYPEQSEAVREAKEKLTLLLRSRALMESGDKEFKIRQVWTGLNADVQGSVSPDGRYLSFVDWETGDLAIRDLTSGTNRRLTNKGSWIQSPEFALFSEWSPDSRMLVYSWYNKDRMFELHTMDIDVAKPRLLFRVKSMWEYVQPFDWSPDGKQILVMFRQKEEKSTPISETASDDAQLGLISVEDGAVRILKTYLTGVYKAPYSFTFSPDGRTIAYDRPPTKDSSNRDIFLLSADGSHEVPLVDHPALDFVLGWSPDGKGLLFASERTGSRSVWFIPVDEGKPAGSPQLIKQDIGPFDPIGFTRQGAFYFGLSIDISDVYVADLDPVTGQLLNPVKKAALDYEGHNLYPAYSPDGMFLAYISQRSNSYLGIRRLLCIQLLKTGEIRELNLDLASYSYPQWSPQGHDISVEGQDDGGRHCIFRVDSQSGKFVPLVQFDLQTNIYSHRWSKDGKAIAAASGGRNAETSSVFLHDIETGEKKKLPGSPSDVKDIGISPDGQWLAFLNREEKRVLRIMPVTGGEVREINSFEQDGRDVISLAWSADGRYIFFSKKRPDQEGMWDLYRVSAEGGKAQKTGLTMNRFLHFSVHPDGRHIAFSSGGVHARFAEVWVMENFLPGRKN